MDLSYTQNLEDYHLALAFAGQASGRYIDIGGGHPVADNVSFWFYERGWQGIVVEPQPALAALYARCGRATSWSRRWSGARTVTAIFSWSSACMVFPPRSSSTRDKAEAFGAGYRKLRLPSVTLATLCETHGCKRHRFSQGRRRGRRSRGFCRR